MADNVQEAGGFRASRNDHATLGIKELYASFSGAEKDLRILSDCSIESRSGKGNIISFLRCCASAAFVFYATITVFPITTHLVSRTACAVLWETAVPTYLSKGFTLCARIA
jgi:hypothetical protein